ncbi:MAG: hypothetical protein L0099_04075 [Acidobacteria bacterium]|nr:hypothetical protein [Acidobacteriota bacterium]
MLDHLQSGPGLQTRFTNLLTCDDAKFLKNEYTLSDGNGEFVFPRLAAFHLGTGFGFWRGEYLNIGLDTAFCDNQHYEGYFLPRLDLSSPNNVRIVMRAEDDGGSNVSRLKHRLLHSPEALQVRREADDVLECRVSAPDPVRDRFQNGCWRRVVPWAMMTHGAWQGA